MANVLVIGGGAAGLLAGIAAAQSGAKTIILEKNAPPRQKKYLLPARGAAILPITAICRKLLKTYPATAAF